MWQEVLCLSTFSPDVLAAAFAPAAVDSRTYREFVSPRGQVPNQSPELRDC
jgi:hypothetical protein